MKKSLLILLATVSLLSGSITGCGYQFRGSGNSLPDDVQKIAIPVVENKTTESGLGLILTEALRSRFERYGVVTLVDDESEADALLEAEISNVLTRVQDVTGQTDIELEQELILFVSAELRRTNGQILWKNPQLVASETFASTSDVVVTSSSNFTQSGLSAASLGSLGAREVARGEKRRALEDLLDRASWKIYSESVASDF